MNKIILLLCAVFAVAKGDGETVRSISFPNNIKANIKDYVEFNQRQYLELLKYFETTIENFKHLYLGKVQVSTFDIDMITDSILEIEARVNPLEVLSDLSNQCVKQHRALIPTAIQVRENITRCIHEESYRVEVSLTSSSHNKDSFQRHYEEYLSEVNNCYKMANNTKCVSDATLKMNSYANSIQKIFKNNMNAAECSAETYVKSAVDCSHTVIKSTISSIAVADLMINNCIEGKKECTPCYPSCTVLDIDVDYMNETMYNPLYNKIVGDECVMFKVNDKH